MELLYPSSGADSLIAALREDGVLGRDVILDIHAEDEMFWFLFSHYGGDRDRALANYFQQGALIWDTLRRIIRWRFKDPGRVRSLLDFASGYGRVTRFMLADLPPERIWVADIYEAGVEFQRRRLGVHGLVSSTRPQDFVPGRRFDCILVSSLFTHLPEESFHGWLDLLIGLLEPGGLLVFSVHDESLLWEGCEMPESGLLFDEESESDSLAKADYGTTWVHEAFVRAAIARAAPSSSVGRLSRGYCNFQDLYVVVVEPGVDFSALDVRRTPEGCVDRVSLERGYRLRLSGWVADPGSGRPVREIQAFVGGRRFQTCAAFHPRPDVEMDDTAEEGTEPVGWGFDFTLPPDLADLAAPLLLRVVDCEGRESTLYLSTLAGALREPMQIDLHETEMKLGQARAEVSSLKEVWACTKYDLKVARLTIAAMEQSKFWRARRAWFAVKRALGLTEES